MTRILVTGASGFIGSHVVPLLLTRGYEVHAVARDSSIDEPEVVTHRFDLLIPGEGRKLVSDVTPKIVLHLAWCAQPQSYRISSDNQRWLKATQELIESFYASGGTRFVGVGTVLEYDPKAEICDEDSTAAAPDTPYGVAKHAAGSFLLRAGEGAGRSGAWARLFHPYGPGEPRAKLVSHIAWHLMRKRRVPLSSGEQVRDYIYVGDAAQALAHLVADEASGIFNVGTGDGVSVRKIAETVAAAVGRPDLLGFGELEGPDTQPPRIIASTQRIRSLGWEPKTDLSTGIERTIESIR